MGIATSKTFIDRNVKKMGREDAEHSVHGNVEKMGRVISEHNVDWNMKKMEWVRRATGVHIIDGRKWGGQPPSTLSMGMQSK